MRRPQYGFSLIEVMLAVAVVAIALLGVIKLMSTTQRGLVKSAASLQAQASAEDLMQKIRQMKWDSKSQPGVVADLNTAPLPSVRDNCSGASSTKTAVEDWNCYKDIDSSRPEFGIFSRTVKVEFVSFDGSSFIPTSSATDRKRVTVTATGPAFEKVQSATVTAVFYNLPVIQP